MKFARFLVQMISGIVNLAVLAFCLLLLSYGCYAIWDSQQLTKAGDTKKYAVYKPTEEDTRSFEELQDINPDVFGWINVYGTSIDYPLVQGEDNSKYVSTNVDGEYSLVGSLFLDYRNQKDFSDFNSIIYGHHMAKDRMFGDIADFAEKDFFDSHRYGTIFFDGRTYGLTFFAFLETDAYDSVYTPGIKGEENQKAYLEKIFKSALYKREETADTAKHLVLLSTCASGMTSGRHILAGYLTERVQPDPFYKEPEEKNLTGIDSQDGYFGSFAPVRKALCVLAAVGLLCGGIYIICRKWKKR